MAFAVAVVALAAALREAPRLPSTEALLVNLSGRGDKDMHTAAEYFGLIDGDATPSGTADEPRAEGDGRTQL